MEKKKLGLVPKLIIAIILGILFGQFLPESICRVVVTASLPEPALIWWQADCSRAL